VQNWCVRQGEDVGDVDAVEVRPSAVGGGVYAVLVAFGLLAAGGGRGPDLALAGGAVDAAAVGGDGGLVDIPTGPAAVVARYAVVHEPGRVAAGDRVVVGVAVPVLLLRVGECHEGIGGDEPAGCRVVFAGAEVGQPGVVADAVDEAAGAGPGRIGAARVA